MAPGVREAAELHSHDSMRLGSSPLPPQLPLIALLLFALQELIKSSLNDLFRSLL